MRIMPKSAVSGHRVYTELRRALLRGELTSGDPLVETDLAASLELSRTPVREALRRLEGDGFVRRQANGSVIVAALEDEDIAALRVEVDTLAARLATQSATEEQWEHLAQLAAAIGAVTPGDAESHHRAHQQFHRALFAIAFRPRMLHVLENHVLQHIEADGTGRSRSGQPGRLGAQASRAVVRPAQRGPGPGGEDRPHPRQPQRSRGARDRSPASAHRLLQRCRRAAERPPVTAREQAPPQLTVRHGRVLTPSGVIPADVGVHDGRIVALAEHLPPAEDDVDAAGLVVLPGLVDVHVHFREPGMTAKEDFATGTNAAAAAGGVTTVLDMPNTSPPVATAADLDAKRMLVEPRARVDFGLFGLFSEDIVKQIDGLVDSGACALKLYMG